MVNFEIGRISNFKKARNSTVAGGTYHGKHRQSKNDFSAISLEHQLSVQRSVRPIIDRWSAFLRDQFYHQYYVPSSMETWRRVSRSSLTMEKVYVIFDSRYNLA